VLCAPACQLVKETTGSTTRLDCLGDALRCRLNGFFCVVNSFRGLVQHGWRITFGGQASRGLTHPTNPLREGLFLSQRTAGLGSNLGSEAPVRCRPLHHRSADAYSPAAARVVGQCACGRITGLNRPAFGPHSLDDRSGPLDREPRMPEMQKDGHRQAFASERACAFHEGDQDIRVDLVPIGFRVFMTEFGGSFYCELAAPQRITNETPPKRRRDPNQLAGPPAARRLQLLRGGEGDQSAGRMQIG
jgi:hypothetical protein